MIAVLLATAALAWESEPAALSFADDNPVFVTFAYDTGYLPSQSDPISVRFSVTPTGGVSASFDAVSQLSWPPVLTHEVGGVAGSGTLEVDAEVEIVAEVYLNLWIWAGSIPLWAQKVQLEGRTDFEPLARDGTSAEVTVADPGLVPPFSFDINVITGIDLSLDVAAYPELVSTLAGTGVTTTNADGASWTQLTEGAGAAAVMAAGRPSELALNTTYDAATTNRLSLVLEPSASLDTWIGNFQLLSFPIPITLVDLAETRHLAAPAYAHPLPALVAPESTSDLGIVDVGDLANLALPLPNAGLLPVDGSLSIVGDPAFTVFPDAIFIPPNGLDGVVVTFTPSRVGAHQAELVITSNDPTTPELRLPLFGEGAAPPGSVDDTGAPADDDGPPDQVVTSAADVAGCGCQSAPAPAVPALGLLTFALLRRRAARTR